jgi:hypothetical protein
MSTFKEQGIDSYPLCWPSGWKRESYRKKSKFTTTFERARVQLFKELKLLGVGDWNVVLSTNLPLRRDGMPYANLANPQDPGVAVYFRYKDKPMAFACDQYQKVHENLYAISKTIEAIRGIERWGASDMMERTFTGFAALPPPQAKVKRQWWQVLGVSDRATADEARAAWRALAFKNHPDRGGSDAAMSEINRAYEEAPK